MSVVIRPPARLEARAGDEDLTVEQLRNISLFANLEKPPELESFPKALVLRHYRAGDVICEQNQPGFTAFYILTPDDLRELREGQLREEQARPGGRGNLVARWKDDLHALGERRAADQPPPPVAQVTIHLPRQTTSGGPLVRLWNALRGAASSETRKAELVEGELFGEMSCLYRQPRSATVVAARDFHAVEFLGHILHSMYTERNKKFKAQLDALYRRRVLGLQLSRVPLFQELGAEHLAMLCAEAELCEFAPGDLLFDEHDVADCMYIVRMGFIKVVTGAASLLGPADVTSWPELCAALRGGATETASAPLRKLWQLLAKPAQEAIFAAPATEKPSDHQQLAILDGLNALLKQPELSAAAEFASVLTEKGLADEAKKVQKLPSPVKKIVKWSAYQEVCRFNRRFLAALLGNSVPPCLTTESSGQVLNYVSTGDPIGEMGLATGKRRVATCVAYVHFGEDKLLKGRVELVRISRALFERLVEAGAVRAKVDAYVQSRQVDTSRRRSLAVWDDKVPAALTSRFSELGLIQGQHLMVIDLDRCTRCDQCVDACVDTHQPPRFGGRGPRAGRDGRSRLFLDGPRYSFFDGEHQRNLLLPATCRQCHDAICLIGCPVGSIHKSDHGEIVIEDWCIGCSRCAQQCPYGAIQMHTIGLLERRSHGWRFAREAASRWQEGATPFPGGDAFERLCPGEGPVHFRRSFELTAAVRESSKSFRVEGVSTAEEIAVYLNGVEVVRERPSSRKPVKLRGERFNFEATLGLPSGAAAGEAEATIRRVLRPGRNQVEVRLVPAAGASADDELLDLGIYAYRKPTVDASLLDKDEYDQELVMNQAVVCDLCGGAPACVSACPHDAAHRVTSQRYFRERRPS
jgi:Fe-S-cluster-containing hydrogenase component 2